MDAKARFAFDPMAPTDYKTRSASKVTRLPVANSVPSTELAEADSTTFVTRMPPR